MKISQAISRTTGPNISLFVFISMHFPCWFQIWTKKFHNSEFYDKNVVFKKIKCLLLCIWHCRKSVKEPLKSILATFPTLVLLNILHYVLDNADVHTTVLLIARIHLAMFNWLVQTWMSMQEYLTIQYYLWCDLAKWVGNSKHWYKIQPKKRNDFLLFSIVLNRLQLLISQLFIRCQLFLGIFFSANCSNPVSDTYNQKEN